MINAPVINAPVKNERVWAAVKAVVVDGDRFLILRTVLPDRELWDLPGGRVEHGETPFDTIVREGKEETGLDLEVVTSGGVYWFYRNDGGQVICHLFLCRVRFGDCSFQGLQDGPVIDSYFRSSPEINDSDLNFETNCSPEKFSDRQWVTLEEFLSERYVVTHPSMKLAVDCALVVEALQLGWCARGVTVRKD